MQREADVIFLCTLNFTLKYFYKYVFDPIKKICNGVKDRYPKVPIIVFPKGSGANYKIFCDEKFLDCLALDSNVSQIWAREEIQPFKPIQGNLDPIHLVTGGDEMISQIDYILENFSNGPYVFNLGHGITPDADPRNIDAMQPYLVHDPHSPSKKNLFLLFFQEY